MEEDRWFIVEVQDTWGWRPVDHERFDTAEEAHTHRGTLTHETRPLMVSERTFTKILRNFC